MKNDYYIKILLGSTPIILLVGLLVYVITFDVDSTRPQELEDKIKELEEIALIEAQDIEIINTSNIEMYYQQDKEKLKHVTNELEVDFSIKNFQNYPLKVTINGVDINGETIETNNIEMSYYGDAKGATKTKEGVGYLHLVLTSYTKIIDTTKENKLRFNITFESEYKEFWETYTVEVDL